MNRWFHPAFETELIEAARFIEQSRAGFGGQFIDEAEATIETMMRSPRIGRAWRDDIR